MRAGAIDHDGCTGLNSQSLSMRRNHRELSNSHVMSAMTILPVFHRVLTQAQMRGRFDFFVAPFLRHLA